MGLHFLRSRPVEVKSTICHFRLPILLGGISLSEGLRLRLCIGTAEAMPFQKPRSDRACPELAEGVLDYADRFYDPLARSDRFKGVRDGTPAA